MNTKEAIEFCKGEINYNYNGQNNELRNRLYLFKCAMKEVIALLKCGEKFEQIMTVKDNRCIIQYKVKGRLFKFEKELVKLFKDNGFKFIGSGFDMCDGVRDLCFERMIGDEELKKELIEQSKETAKLNLEICKEFEHTDTRLEED